MPRQLKHAELADDPKEENYSYRPVENFGMHMLESMGYSKEKGIGKNSKTALDDVLVLKPRPKGMGLGAEKEKEQKKEQFKAGNYVLITQKQHKDLAGIIIEVHETNLLIELLKSHSQLHINKNHVKILTNDEVKQIQLGQSKEGKQGKQEESQKRKKLKWIVPGLRVKVVNKKSPYYLKKVVVTDLISEREFECLYEGQDGKVMIRDLRQKDVQTMIPKKEEVLLVLRGQHKGEKARVFHRDKKNEKLTVQSIVELELITLPQDDVCEYVEL